ncbi:AmmeMemoRadiSam system protein A [Endozoicomonas sp. SCSIO W0465]|uniref:AmmeMemoRadiSam system protein A n=1 Tax=Endozoicomonas sp. SCSIO W0465 TaxID=2918516 RepID=UPI002075BD60|nr:AmmeMemoRadiSam system protein A [Endozoicomonas sp. SCSIO W0465]USE38474.1 AmmeMemoRadiSam system protein A [Endozoicomonas sp. SCSIO W0465]
MNGNRVQNVQIILGQFQIILGQFHKGVVQRLLWVTIKTGKRLTTVLTNTADKRRKTGISTVQIEPTESQKRELLRLARKTISEGCTLGLPPESLPERKESEESEDRTDCFLQKAASFVTLQKRGQLRGCIGTTQAYRTLLDDVIHNAFASAFRDSRFPPVTENELTDIKIEISILTPQERMEVTDEKDLLQQLHPGIDGLLIRHPQYTATFLPQVWKQLPNPRQFLAHLKSKAGMAPGLWPEGMECFRYRCVKFEERRS